MRPPDNSPLTMEQPADPAVQHRAYNGAALPAAVVKEPLQPSGEGSTTGTMQVVAKLQNAVPARVIASEAWIPFSICGVASAAGVGVMLKLCCCYDAWHMYSSG